MRTIANVSITHPLLMQNEEYKAMAERSKFLEKVRFVPNRRRAKPLLDALGFEKYEDLFEPNEEGFDSLHVNGNCYRSNQRVSQRVQRVRT